MQQSIFDMLYPKYKIKKPIRLIEFFAGYGSQALALKYLGVEFEHWRICEWAIKSIQAYKDIHFPDDNTDYSKKLTKDNIIHILNHLGISSNYNEPMTLKQIQRLNEKQLRIIYNNIIATHNLVDIQKVEGEDLSIVDTDKYEYILTYSFPCQDLSLAGKGKGMSDTSTRSGMLWEVERILKECKELGNLPQVLLMENVPQVHSQDNVTDFNKWQLELEKLGYKNYFQDLIATDYGIPQTRNRCFMISILGDYSYTFPKPIPLELKLKDMLEDNVDEKYYLSDKQLESLESGSYNASKPSVKLEITDKGLCQTLDTMSGGNRQPLVRVGNKSLGVSFRNNTFLAIKNATKKGYLEATDGDGVDISSRMEHHRGTVQKGKTQTITTMGGKNNGVVITNIKNINNENNCFSTLGTNCGSSTSAGGGVVLKNDLRIRKLTPKECFRLMGVKDEDFEKGAKNQSDSSLYHLAGDSIVVNVLMAIFSQLLDIKWEDKI